MLEIEVHLAQETKALEWNKAHPTFRELKERLRQCGIAAGKNFCVEVERGREFVTLDDDDLLDGPLIRVRASQIRCTTPWKRPTPDQPPMKDRSRPEKSVRTNQRRNSDVFMELVIPFVGRVFVLPKKLQELSMDDCTGTVGLVGPKGESVGAFHAIKKAWRHPCRYDVYIKYANHNKQPCFPAKILTYNEETDVFLASPLPPFDFSFPKFLHPASGIAVGDTVHCLGFPKLGTGTLTLALSEQEFPAVFSGNVCFSGWKQALADYRSFPNCSGAVVVDDCGRLKGIHVSALSAAEFIPDIRSEDEGGRNVRERTKELVERMNSCLPQLRNGVKRTAEAAVFVPINVLMKSLAISPTKAVLHL